MRIYLKWTEKELEYLKNNYELTSIDILQKNLRNRNKDAILKKAQVLGFKKATTRLSQSNILLQETPESYYWIGFLLADGGFTNRRITLKINNKDKDHLLKFQKYINSTNKIREKDNCVQLRITDIKTVTELRNKFGISNKKTYYPCNIYQIRNDDLLFALIVGFIDGDGCIRKTSKYNSYNLFVIGHSSWISNFEYMEDNLRRITNFPLKRSAKVRVHKTSLPQNKGIIKEYNAATFYISKFLILSAIHKKALDLKLPFMKRKLGKIPL